MLSFSLKLFDVFQEKFDYYYYYPLPDTGGFRESLSKKCKELQKKVDSKQLHRCLDFTFVSARLMYSSAGVVTGCLKSEVGNSSAVSFK